MRCADLRRADTRAGEPGAMDGAHQCSPEGELGRGRGLERSRRCSRMAQAVEERRTKSLPCSGSCPLAGARCTRPRSLHRDAQGEFLALQREDVDLEARTILVRRSWERATTKGGYPDCRGPRPLVHRRARGLGELVFPAPGGGMFRRDVDLEGASCAGPSAARALFASGDTSAAAGAAST